MTDKNSKHIYYTQNDTDADKMAGQGEKTIAPPPPKKKKKKKKLR